jgi:thiamine biosynthesis lipoprotein
MIQVPASLLSQVLMRVSQSARAASQGELYRLTCQAMSTPVRLAFSVSSPTAAHDFQKVAIDWISHFEARYSRFLPDSIVGQINASSGGDWVDIDDDADQLFSLCSEMYSLTSGAFDPAALPLLRLWDWKAVPPRVPNESAIRSARAVSGWEKIQRRKDGICLPINGMGIDLGGIGKEFAVDQLLLMAGQRGLENVMIDIGQDLRVSGHPPGKDAWYIGLEEPKQPGQCWTALRLTEQAVATSGDYFRSFIHDGRRYGHIVDPRTGQPVNNDCQAVSVIAPSCVLAGVLSTAAFILGPTEGLELIRSQPNVEACITTANARHQTRRFSSYVPM